MKKILLIEDDKWFADSLVSSLSQDFEVRVCSDIENFFDTIENFTPDLLLADVILGTKNVFILLNELQSHVDVRMIKVVILTSSAKQIKLHDVANFNVKKVLDKAKIEPKALRKTLHKIFENDKKEKFE